MKYLDRKTEMIFQTIFLVKNDVFQKFDCHFIGKSNKKSFLISNKETRKSTEKSYLISYNDKRKSTKKCLGIFRSKKSN